MFKRLTLYSSDNMYVMIIIDYLDSDVLYYLDSDVLYYLDSDVLYL